jgi:uncharacterized membrane protein YqjE
MAASARGNGALSDNQPSIGDLFRQLSADASLLVRQEVALARVEVMESARQLAKASMMLAIALILGLAGMMALAAFLVIALANAIDSWWASALIVGVVLSATAGLLVRSALEPLRSHQFGLSDTTASLGEGARWANRELRAFKNELTA